MSLSEGESRAHLFIRSVWLQGSFGLCFLFSGACHGFPMFGGKADLGMVWD